MFKWSKKRKQKNLLDEIPSDPPLSFTLMLPGQKELTGKLADMNAESVALVFSESECPELDIDERLRLELTVKDSEQKLMLDVLVTDSERLQESVLYQFKFIDTSHLLRDLDPMFLSYFNRRDAFRVRPDPAEPIMVNLKWNDIESSGEIIDISVTGIAIKLESATARQLDYADGIYMDFWLPGFKQPFNLIAKTAHFESMPKGVRYAIRFDRKNSPRIRAQEHLISRYIMHRQLAMLKRRSDQISTSP